MPSFVLASRVDPLVARDARANRSPGFRSVVCRDRHIGSSRTALGPSATIARLDGIGDERCICGWIVGVALIITGRTADEPVVMVPFPEVKCPLFVEPLEKIDLEAYRLEQLDEGAIGVEDMVIARPV